MESKNEKWGALFLGCIFAVAVALSSSQPLPVVHRADGECVKVERSVDGQVLEQDCFSIDLERDRYHTKDVATAAEAVEITSMLRDYEHPDNEEIAPAEEAWPRR